MEHLKIIQNGWKRQIDCESGIYFNDGERKIDIVMAFEDSEDEDDNAEETTDGTESKSPGSRVPSFAEGGRSPRLLPSPRLLNSPSVHNFYNK
jgi:hypothetical protein